METAAKRLQLEVVVKEVIYYNFSVSQRQDIDVQGP